MEQHSTVMLIGSRKRIMNYRIKSGTFWYFLKHLFRGEIRGKYFIRIIRRLLFFLSQMKHNKYVKIGKRVKINLYVPAYPTKAFFTACKKVLEFKEKMPCVTVLLSITSACKFKCDHCYQSFDKGKDINIDFVLDTVRKLQNKGLAFFNIEGGEPFLVFDRLKMVCKEIDDRSEILINSTGEGISSDRLLELKKNKNLIGIMFSLRTHDPKQMNEMMGREDAWDIMINGINLCHKTGIPVMFNSCLLRNDFYDGTFEKVMNLAKDLNGAILQLIKPKPAGGWLATGADLFTDEDIRYIKNEVNKYNLKPEFSEYPHIAAMVIEEDPSLFGCTSGATDRFYINAKGDLQPCEFLNISFGNIQTDDFDTIYERMREHFKVPGDCLLCEKYSKEIYHLYKKNNLDTLPLSPELSEKIYENWDRGKPSRFYRIIERL